MANSTDDFIVKLKDRLKKLEQNLPLKTAVLSVHSIMVDRIFNKGENANSGKIGKYNSTDELYVNPKFSPKKFPTKGKTGKTKFKNGNIHKTGFFKSYKDFRSAQGRQTGFVNLNLSGILFRDFAASLTRVNANQYQTGLKNKANIGKLEGNEDRFGNNIFKLTKSEKKELVKIITKERLRIGI